MTRLRIDSHKIGLLQNIAELFVPNSFSQKMGSLQCCWLERFKIASKNCVRLYVTHNDIREQADEYSWFRKNTIGSYFSSKSFEYALSSS